MLKELISPNKNKILLSIPVAMLFWFFPIISKSIVAIPFINFSSLIFSLIINLAIAYVFSCLIINSIGDKKKLIVVVFIIIVIYLVIPKISNYNIGDIGGTSYTYCDCYGLKWKYSACCGSTVSYCTGICKKNEQTVSWPKY